MPSTVLRDVSTPRHQHLPVMTAIFPVPAYSQAAAAAAAAADAADAAAAVA